MEGTLSVPLCVLASEKDAAVAHEARAQLQDRHVSHEDAEVISTTAELRSVMKRQFPDRVVRDATAEDDEWLVSGWSGDVVVLEVLPGEIRLACWIEPGFGGRSVQTMVDVLELGGQGGGSALWRASSESAGRLLANETHENIVRILNPDFFHAEHEEWFLGKVTESGIRERYLSHPLA